MPFLHLIWITCMYVDTEMMEHWDVEAIYFNGRKQTHCIAAHEGEGWVERYLTDEAGPVLGPHGKDMTERVEGKVVIHWKKGRKDGVNWSQITREIVGR